MVLKVEQERVHALLKDTITLLCRNGLSFKSQFSVEALIGITLDKEDIFLININEIIKSETNRKADELAEDSTSCDEEIASNSNSNSDAENQNRKRRRRKRKLKIKSEIISKEGGESDDNDTHERFEEHSESEPLNKRGDDQMSPVCNPNSKSFSNFKQDKDESSLEDIIIIKEEVNEDWPQFCEQNTFPSTSIASTPHKASSSQNQSFMSPSSTFMTSQDGGFDQVDWSPAMSSQAQQFQSANNPTATDSSQQMLGPFICTLCGTRLANRNNFRQHLKRHEGKYNYHCPICKKGFSSSGILRGHMSWHTGVKEFKCTFCTRMFRYSQDLKHHMVVKHS